MRIIFAGTPDIAVPSLEAAIQNAEVIAVLTNPDAPIGRSRKPVASPIKEKALEHNIPVLQPEKLDKEFREQIAQLKPDLLVSFAYGKIFGPKTLASFPLGGINIHPSLLPKYRGPAPINAAILNRDKCCGISIQELALEMDCGDILLQDKIKLDFKETTESLSEKVSYKAAKMLARVLVNFEEFSENARPQCEDDACYCSLLKKEDGQIDWALSAEEISAKVRAYCPWPGSYTFAGDKRINIIDVALVEDEELLQKYLSEDIGKVIEINKQLGIIIKTGDGLIAIKTLQLHTKKALDFMSFVNGFSLKDVILG